MSYDPFRNYRFTTNRKRYPNWFEYFDMMNADQDMEKVMTGVLNSLRELTEPEPTHRVFKHVYTRTITANGRTFKVTVEELMDEEDGASAESEDPEPPEEDLGSEE
jgi:hypothetical protein